MTTFNGVPLSLANYEGAFRYAYVIEGRAYPVPEGSRAVYFAKEGERRYKSAEVWSRGNDGTWAVNEKYNAEMRRQVANLLPYDAEALKANPKLEPKMYTAPKDGAVKGSKVVKTGLQASLSDLAVLSRTLARNMSEGFTLTANDFVLLDKAMLAVMELTQAQGPEIPPAQ